MTTKLEIRERYPELWEMSMTNPYVKANLEIWLSEKNNYSIEKIIYNMLLYFISLTELQDNKIKELVTKGNPSMIINADNPEVIDAIKEMINYDKNS